MRKLLTFLIALAAAVLTFAPVSALTLQERAVLMELSAVAERRLLPRPRRRRQ